MKQRPLTETECSLLKMQKSGWSTDTIAHALSISPKTVEAKQRALAKGLEKNAYILPVDLQQLLGRQAELIPVGAKNATA
jgi:hypothetical protein